MDHPRNGTPPGLWDPVVRLTHWVIAGVVVANAVLTEGGGALHVWLGWTGMAFMALRLIWGLAGSPEARFSAFPPRIIPALSHLNRLRKGKSREFPSHNPAGALMIYAFWATLAIMFATGLAMTSAATPWEVARQNDAVAAGDWSALVTIDGGGAAAEKDGRWIEELHKFGADLLLLLAVLHLAGVMVESMLLRRSLVRPMLFGKATLTQGLPPRAAPEMHDERPRKAGGSTQAPHGASCLHHRPCRRVGLRHQRRLLRLVGGAAGSAHRP